MPVSVAEGRLSTAAKMTRPRQRELRTSYGPDGVQGGEAVEEGNHDVHRVSSHRGGPSAPDLKRRRYCRRAQRQGGGKSAAHGLEGPEPGAARHQLHGVSPASSS